ncbi:MAG: type I DNA topoisomerase [Bacteroidota bacterium]
MKLVIVESPAKAKTIQGYLGRGYRVRASLGHVRDLPRKDVAVDVEKTFKPKYETLSAKKKTMKSLRDEARRADQILLATDPDREGEIIAYHLAESLKRVCKDVARVTFQEVTKPAVQAAVRAPRRLDGPLIEAQQARRVMDRLVGYTISPFLWKTARGEQGLSAGRVQTAALRLLCERETAIADFVPEDYWSLDATFATEKGEKFGARLVEAYGEKIGSPADVQKGREQGKVKRKIPDEGTAVHLRDEAEMRLYAVRSLTKKTARIKPPPPFTTSTLQQAASARLKMSPKQTMRIAQQLFEGVEIGDGSRGTEERVGLITYMRTDSTRISDEAIASIRDLIARDLGLDFLPKSPHRHGKKSKNAQEAHEAIRPTRFDLTPKAIRKWLTPEQHKLYRLIFYRTVASQMAPAVVDRTTAEVASTDGAFVFLAKGEVTRFRGFRAVYDLGESHDDSGEDEAEQAARGKQRLPESLRKGLPVNLLDLATNKHQTKPPPRYTEASLVKALERHGIGRPSTYSATIATLQNRGYAELQKRVLHASDLGLRVCDLLVQHFPKLFDLGFTAKMEEALDQIAAGKRAYRDTLRTFYHDRLLAALHDAEAALASGLPPSGPSVRPAASASSPASTTASPSSTAAPSASSDDTPRLSCPRCGKPLARRDGAKGPFYGCTGFPTCRHTMPFFDPRTAPRCPICHRGWLVERRAKSGNVFRGCTTYPACSHTEPVPEAAASATAPARTPASRRRTSPRGLG